MNIVIHPSYFPSVSQFVAIAQADKIMFEMEDNFQKQTNRNRAYIYSPNGTQILNIPVKHSKIAHPKTKDVIIENDFNWQKQHLKSLEAAYRSSPFFEYFEDELVPIFEKKQHFLMDLNFESMEFVQKCLRMKLDHKNTTEYFQDLSSTGIIDFRFLANRKKDISEFESYTQVFCNKHGYLNNLSILDLIFNEGKFAMDYLKRQKITEIFPLIKL